MALSPTAIKEVDLVLKRISRQVWNLPASFPKAGLHALLEEVGLNIPSVWVEFWGTALRSFTKNLNDEGALGTIARASIRRASNKFRHWPLELAFHSHKKGQTPIYTSAMARNMAALLLANLHPTGGPEIWSGNGISSSITSRIPRHVPHSLSLSRDSPPMDKVPTYPHR